MAFALIATVEWRGRVRRVVRIYATAESCVEHAAPHCEICAVPDHLLRSYDEEDTDHLLAYIDGLPEKQRIQT